MKNSKFKIVFIDEEQESLDDFLYYINRSTHKTMIESIVLKPEPEISDMINKIITINPDIIISDYMLNEAVGELGYNVSYDGTELIMEFLKIREGFPCFVMTALDDEAIVSIDDVNMVYIKKIMHTSYNQSDAKADFIQRIIRQAENYKSRIEKAEQELLKLIKLRRTNKASIKDEQQILELDSFLERSIDKRNSIPKEYKTLSNNKMLTDLLKHVDCLIEELGHEN